MRGNTCAHFMNVLSTVNALPQMSADVQGMISIMFVGKGSLEKAFLRDIFQVQKEKVW